MEGINQFEIEHDDIYGAIIQTLVDMASRERAIHEIFLHHLVNVTSNTKEELFKMYDETRRFHRDHVYTELYTSFASLKGFFDKGEPPKSE